MLADAYPHQLEGVWWISNGCRGRLVASYLVTKTGGLWICTDADGMTGGRMSCKVMALTARLDRGALYF